MQTKLTLRLDRKLIERAKAYAKRSQKSLSQVIGEYFALLEAEPPPDPPLTPVVAQLRGVLRGSSVDREDYRTHLEEKYL